MFYCLKNSLLLYASVFSNLIQTCLCVTLSQDWAYSYDPLGTSAVSDIPWVYCLQKVTCKETCRKKHIIVFAVGNVVRRWRPWAINLVILNLHRQLIAFYTLCATSTKRMYFSIKAETRHCSLGLNCTTVEVHS